MGIRLLGGEISKYLNELQSLGLIDRFLRVSGVEYIFVNNKSRFKRITESEP